MKNFLFSQKEKINKFLSQLSINQTIHIIKSNNWIEFNKCTRFFLPISFGLETEVGIEALAIES